MYSIEKVSLTDIEELVRVQTAAFARDKDICGFGPPGFDNKEHQIKATKNYSYYAIRHLDNIVGGFYFSVTNTGINLIRLFVEPNYQCCGIGSIALDFLIEQASKGSVIDLETPTFSVNAQRFYEKNGFHKVSVIKYGAGDSYLYRKLL
ncbi:acetyltransferase [Vibrio parahaemolyticus]|uniref:GNAT family N-acetyltransferase n=1 Tax=Vibrio parahaemolyticus TaxID=670 RepID=UPI0006A5E705|nr:GNAT family N-acetyltransferase [Vibrio parahaemolyticus]KOC97960.1 acetyltransferase [Vibrio parahaemolyticus]